MDKLKTLLKIEAAEITASFKKASIEGEGTPQEISDRREEVLKSFLAKYFPFPFRIVKGNIIDTYGMRSNSIDCIIINPSHPYTVDPKNEKASIIFADGVDYAIEIKPDLTSETEIIRGLKQIQSVKKLRRKRTGLLSIKDNVNIEYGKQIPAVIFADNTYVNLKTLIEHIVNYYVDNSVPQEEQFDLIVINNRTIVYNFRENSYVSSSALKGIYCANMGEDTIAMFLLWLNKTPKSEPEISTNIMKLYLNDIKIEEVEHYEELNEKLNSI